MVESVVAKGESFTQTLLRGPDGRLYLRTEGRWWKAGAAPRPFRYLCEVFEWLGSVKYCVDPAEREAAWEVVRAVQFAN